MDVQNDSSSTYGFENIEEIVELSVENIFKRISEAILWRHYIGSSFQLHKAIPAPYRIDNSPSFNLFYDSRKRIMFKDHGRNVYGDIFDYVGLVNNLGFYESLLKVNCDFDLGLGTKLQRECCQNSIVTQRVTKQEQKVLKKFNTEFTRKDTTFIRIDPRRYNQEDLDYWAQYGIVRDTLILYNVYCVQRLFINGNLNYSYSHSNPGYAYYFPRSNHIKCYFPFSASLRFVGNVNNMEDIQGYDQCEVKALKENKFLILTKSMKDCMLLHQLGFDAMAIHGEGQFFNKDFIRHVKKYYSKIISLYDRDKTGVKGAKFLWKEYRISAYFINKKLEEKDISDVYKRYGEEQVRNVLKEIIEDSGF